LQPESNPLLINSARISRLKKKSFQPAFVLADIAPNDTLELQRVVSTGYWIIFLKSAARRKPQG